MKERNPNDPFDDLNPWPVPDEYQCQAQDDRGHRCVLSINHPPKANEPGGHMLRAVKTK